MSSEHPAPVKSENLSPDKSDLEHLWDGSIIQVLVTKACTYKNENETSFILRISIKTDFQHGIP